MPKPTSAAEPGAGAPRLRVVLVTMDGHLAQAALRASEANLRRAQAVANVTAHYSLSTMVMAWESLYPRIIAEEKP